MVAKQIYLCFMTNILVLLGYCVYDSLELIESVDDDGMVVLMTILAIYWYICWWVTFSFIYLVIGIGILSYYLSNWISGFREPAALEEDYQS